MPRNLADAIIRQQQQAMSTTQLRSFQRGRIVAGGTSGSGGGSGGPPGGIVGKWPQTSICYDTTEATTSSGSTSLLDNLNHIRQLVLDAQGDIVGPETSTDHAIARWDGTSGSILLNTGVTIDDSNNVLLPGQLVIDGTANTKQLIIQAHSTQTNPLIQLQSSAGVALMDIHSNHVTNVFVGVGAGQTASGQGNTFIGGDAGWLTTTGSKNAAVGYEALAYCVAGTQNTALGFGAGGQAGILSTGSGNVFLGYYAGFNEPGANKLYIENSASANPLIYGEFDNDLLRINGSFEVGRDSALRGALTLWDGAGGNTPGYAAIGSPNGTVWYIFVEDDGTVKIHNAAPIQNSDGSEVGAQT